MGKKNLDKLFQEKLKDFSEVPDDAVWQSIEASLDEKKKSRRILPIWWKVGGVAAVLLIAMSLFNPFKNTVDDSNIPSITDTEVETEKSSKENNTQKTFDNQNANKNQIVEVEKEPISNIKESSSNQIGDVDSATTSKEDIESSTVQKSSQQKGFNSQNAVEVQIANTSNAGTDKVIKQNENIVSENSFDKLNEETEIADSKLEKNLFNENENVTDNHLVNDKSESSKVSIAATKRDESIEDTNATKKKSLFDEIAAQEQEEVIVENSKNRWSAGPSIAPVYFDAIGEGSPIHSIFVPNNKSGEVNLSYGFSVAYAVSKKLSIRSGVHKVDYGYSTNDVAFSSSLEGVSISKIDNIDYALSSRNILVGSKVNTRIELLDQNSFLDSSSDVSAAGVYRDGVMEQQFGYLEVPIELKYTLVNNKFGINLIGGVSSLFLIDNSISLSSGELITDVGEANNINSVNFSANAGFGMNYKVSPKVQLNIEPVFKYQLNTFSETDGTFNPFSVGVYSGLNFKF